MASLARGEGGMGNRLALLVLIMIGGRLVGNRGRNWRALAGRTIRARQMSDNLNKTEVRRTCQ